MSNCVESCKECVRRIVRFLNELRAVTKIDRRYLMCLIELRAVRSLLGEL